MTGVQDSLTEAADLGPAVSGVRSGARVHAVEAIQGFELLTDSPKFLTGSNACMQGDLSVLS